MQLYMHFRKCIQAIEPLKQRVLASLIQMVVVQTVKQQMTFRLFFAIAQ